MSERAAWEAELREEPVDAAPEPALEPSLSSSAAPLAAPASAGARLMAPEHHDDDAGAPHLDFSRRTILGGLAFVLLAIAALYLLLPQLAGLEETWARIEDGSPFWLLVCLLFTLGMFGGYVALFQGVFARAGARLTLRESYQITMAGLAATRLLSAGGAGGIVLTAWALRRAGMNARTVADKTISFLVLTYLVYMAALILCGFGLYFGVLPGPAPVGMTLIPALVATGLTVAGLSLSLVPEDVQRRVESFAEREGHFGRLARRLGSIPAAMSAGVRDALAHARSHDPALLGAVVYWGCQIGVLWASFRAFGDAPPMAVIIVAFFVGMVGNLLPLPGGVGGVDGGMIGAFAAFGVSAGLAVVAVLVYRGFTFWLPTLPGAVAYLQLRKTVERWRGEHRGERYTIQTEVKA